MTAPADIDDARREAQIEENFLLRLRLQIEIETLAQARVPQRIRGLEEAVRILEARGKEIALSAS